MKFFLVVPALLAISTGAIAESTEPPTGTAALLCQMSRHGLTSTETLSIDYDQKLVNANPAIFTASMITWTEHKSSQNEHHELNRLTGTYNYWADERNPGEPMPTFVCTKAPIKF